MQQEVRQLGRKEETKSDLAVSLHRKVLFCVTMASGLAGISPSYRPQSAFGFPTLKIRSPAAIYTLNVGREGLAAIIVGASSNLDGHFAVGIPEHRSVNPFSERDWDVIGVEPDVKVKASSTSPITPFFNDYRKPRWRSSMRDGAYR